jgi:hypothetical protein
MVERGAHIDLFFRNGLKEYEVLPPSEIWENIKPAIAGKRRSFIVLKAAAAAVILVSLGTTFFLLTRNLPDKFAGPAISLNQESVPEGAYIAKAETLPAPNAGHSLVKPEEIKAENIIAVGPENETLFRLPVNELVKSAYPGSQVQKNIGNISLINPALTDLQNSAGNKINFMPEEINNTGTNKLGNRWSIGVLATPAYYSKFNFDNNDAANNLIKSEKATASYSGGVAFSYAVNKRISLQTGLYYSSLGQKVTGISSYAGFRSYYDVKAGSDFIVKTSSGIITSYNKDIYLMDNTSNSRVVTRYTMDVFDPYKANLDHLDNSVEQNFKYLEIPFILRYKIIDRKIDFDLIGGLSYNLLVANSAYVVSGGSRYYLGDTKGLSPVTFSSSLGVGMEYGLTKKISLNFEPTFRYYITPLGGLEGSSIHQYSFGILTGIFYKF